MSSISFDRQKSIRYKENDINDQLIQPLKVLDFGPKYVQVTNLAIWLIKWSSRFQKVLTSSPNTFNYFSRDKTIDAIITINVNSLTANMLVGCVYMADGNDLDQMTRSRIDFIKKDVSSHKSR